MYANAIRNDLIEMCSFAVHSRRIWRSKLYYVVFECVSFGNFPLIQVQTHTPTRTQSMLLLMAVSMNAPLQHFSISPTKHARFDESNQKHNILLEGTMCGSQCIYGEFFSSFVK